MARKAVKREQGATPSQSRGAAATPVHRYTFLQWLMPRGYDLQSEAERIYRKLTGAKDLTAFNTFLSDINEGLEFIEFEVDDEWYLGFVNKVSDSAAKLLVSRYKHEQLAYFKSVVEAIAESEEVVGGLQGKPYLGSTAATILTYDTPQTQGAGTATQATQASQRKTLTSGEKERALQSLAADGWLAHTQGESAYSIGPRTFLELRQLLGGLELSEARRAAWSQVL